MLDHCVSKPVLSWKGPGRRDGQVQGSWHIYTHQAYWSLKNQKTNDQTNWKVNYDLNMDSEKRKVNCTGDASATQCKNTSLISHTDFLSGNQRPNPVFPCLR